MPIDDLTKFVEEHTLSPEDASGNGTIVDVSFFNVAARGDDHDKDKFLELVTENENGAFASVNPFDGREHDYLELGGWIGDQGTALRFMALCEYFDVAKLNTPKSLFGSNISLEIETRMAGAGHISIKAEANPTEA